MHNDRQPLYVQIQDHFKKLIGSGKLLDDDKIPSEKELMEQFNVSRITVANALAQMAKDGWIYRIPGRGSFVRAGAAAIQQSPPLPPPQSGHDSSDNVYVAAPDQNPATASEGRKMIGFIIPTMEDYFALRLLKGINDVLNDSNYFLTIVLTNHSKEREKEAIRELIRKGAAGLIIFPIDAETYNEEILALKIQGFPFVLIDRFLPGVETHFVCSDSFLGAKLAVSHLWDLGHRDIAICSDSPLATVTVEQRIAGYMEALKQKGAMINPSLMLTEFTVDYKGVDQQHPLYRYIQNRLATAYITLNAKLGLHICAIVKKLGMRIPEDVSVVTFDDPSFGIEEVGRYTHVAQSEEEIGNRAAGVLIGLLDRNEAHNGHYSKIILKPKLVIRDSTGPVKK